MITVGVLSSESHISLKEYLNSKDTLKVIHSWDSLAKNQSTLFSKLINLDKLVILDRFKDTGSMIQEFSVLKSLLSPETYGFFRPKEILYLMSEGNEEYYEFFKVSMEDSGFTNYEMKVGTDFTPAAVYNHILGLEKENIIEDNRYKNLYRVRKNREETTSFQLKGLEEINLEPFNYSSVDSYEETKKQIKLVMSETVHKDLEMESEIGELKEEDHFEDVPGLDRLDIKENNLVLVTGERSSGKTTLILGLATSAFHNNKNVLIVDLQDNNSTSLNLKILEVETNILNVSELEGNFGRMEEFINSDLNISCISFDGTRYKDSFKLTMMDFIFRSADLSKFDKIIVDFPLPKYANFYRYVNSCSKIFITTSLRLSTVRSLLDLVEAVTDEKFMEKEKVVVPMSVYSKLSDSGYLTVTDLRDMLKKRLRGFKLTSELKFSGLNLSSEFYASLLG